MRVYRIAWKELDGTFYIRRVHFVRTIDELIEAVHDLWDAGIYEMTIKHVNRV
jgi:hypothetical protein